MDKTETKSQVPELKNMVVIDSKDTNAVIVHSGGTVDEPKKDIKPSNGADKSAEAPEQETGESNDDFAKRLGLTKEQHEAITEMTQKAVGKKHRQYKETEEFAKNLYNEKILAEEKAAKAERELQRIKAAQTTEPAKEATKPDRKDFKTDAEFNEALISFEVDQRLAKREAEQQAKAREDVQRERAAKYDGQMAVAREAGPGDFIETMESVEGREDIRIPEAVSAYLYNESDKVPEVLYHLIKTPEVLDSLWKMTPMRQVIEIGKIESTLKSFVDKTPKADAKASQDADKASSNGKQEAATPSKARAPAITPITQGSESQVSGGTESSFEQEFEKYRTEKAPGLLRRKRH